MAHLSERVARTGRRGQIMLVTALVLGVAFVALALILNSAIFTENLASRGDTTGADGAVTYQSNLQDGVGNIVAFETRNATSGETHETVLGRVEEGVTDATTVAVRRQAKSGVVANASITDTGNGSRIFQTDSTRNFADGDGDPEWTVAANVDATRAFEMNISRSAVPSTCTLFSDCFTMNVTDGTDDWRVSIGDTGSNEIEVRVHNGSAAASCDVVNEPFVTVDVTAGTVNGSECRALNVSEAPGDSYSIKFNNSDRVGGTYSLVVDNEGIAEGSVPAHFDVGPEPTVTPAVYNLTLRYQYETSDLRVATDLRVAPGEPDGR